AVEAALRGRPSNTETFREAAAHAAEGARPASQNAFKVTLAERALQRALEIAAA
ncbi:MAG: xanthine dehydrogenase family protein subunit M, partial [Acetobacteraceae bacterium]|nr:xanthine dehydrogenase family protein subunit M [Acetobacteraceae bacterium]